MKVEATQFLASHDFKGSGMKKCERERVETLPESPAQIPQMFSAEEMDDLTSTHSLHHRPAL